MNEAVPTVPEGTCVYAIGDIHGRHDLLSALHGLIESDSDQREGARRVIVYLGDYVDRGPESRSVLETLSSSTLTGFETVHLRGNHEDFLSRFLRDPEIGPIWFYNGGVQTLESYGVTVTAIDHKSLATAQVAFQEAFPGRHEAFVNGLGLTHVEGDYAFVHAGIRPGVPFADQRPEDLIWIRDEFLHDRTCHEYIIVHGHSIEWQPQVRPNRIGIDTGAFASGVLTALVLEGSERDFLHTMS